MELQICSRVLVQPSCVVLPHIPWLSGVAEPQLKPSAGTIGTLSVGTPSGVEASGAGGGSVAQPRASTTRGMATRRGGREGGGSLILEGYTGGVVACQPSWDDVF